MVKRYLIIFLTFFVFGLSNLSAITACAFAFQKSDGALRDYCVVCNNPYAHGQACAGLQHLANDCNIVCDTVFFTSGCYVVLAVTFKDGASGSIVHSAAFGAGPSPQIALNNAFVKLQERCWLYVHWKHGALANPIKTGTF